jgi:hypothetical protein
MSEEAVSFPKTVFVQGLPDSYSLANLAALLEQFGNILEMQIMDDGHVLVRFQDSVSAEKAVGKAGRPRKDGLIFNGNQLTIIPKNKRKGTS